MRTVLFSFLALLLAGTGCSGYHFQGSYNPLLEQEGVRRVYVAPLVNNSYKAGVENLVYNALIRALSAGKRVTLVRHPEESDAVLQGVITAAHYSGSAPVLASRRPPGVPTVDPNVQVFTQYTTVLDCSFALNRRIVPPGKTPTIWQAGFSRAKPFPSAVQLDVPGATTALINESEFERALADLAADMMADVHESMLATF
ncbi:MAG: hypothetical protein A2X94_16405 [Bdellovibrionales bacterium GWB1_55_8]|nr:MAG: hypothetical protein A2X94_16405 [Bdellovibrionales bacterium GWB1_55_8]